VKVLWNLLIILYPTILWVFCWSTIGAVPCTFTDYSVHHTWVPLTMEDMNFLSLTFIIEIIKKPKLKMYWTDHPVCGTPIFFPKQCHANCVQTPHSSGRDSCNSTVTCFNLPSSSLPKTSGVTRWAAAKDLPYRLNRRREEHVLLHFPQSKTDKTCSRIYIVCLKKNSWTLDGFVKNVGSHCTHDCTAQDITH